MKKTLIIVSSLLSLGASAFSTDWKMGFDVPDETKEAQNLKYTWDQAVGSAETAGYWFSGETRTDANSMRGSYDIENDTFTIGTDETYGGRIGIKGGVTTTVYDSIYVNLTKDVTIKQITFISKSWDSSGRIDAKGFNLTVTGDVIRAATASHGYINNTLKMTIQGDLQVIKNNFAISSKKTIIEGNFVGGGSFYAITNASDARGAAGTFEQGLADPDLVIKGTVQGGTLWIKPNTYDAFASIGGLENDAKVSREALANGAINDRTSYAILTNKNDYTTSGNIVETNGDRWVEGQGKFALVMNGPASQAFTSDRLKFQGGVKAIDGTIKLNFNQSNVNNWYYRDANKKIKVFFSKTDGGGNDTSLSHGNLELLGGTFGSTEANGSFRFTNVVYTSGTISLGMESATNFASIDLTSYYNRVVDTTGASEVVTYEAVAGGTLSKVDGAGKVAFNFGDNLEWLIDAADDGVKVIAWDAAKKSALTADDFIGNIFTNTEGDQFKAQFAVNDDGLYVKYVAVPEPATVAAIFGALALAFAAYRRKK